MKKFKVLNTTKTKEFKSSYAKAPNSIERGVKFISCCFDPVSEEILLVNKNRYSYLYVFDPLKRIYDVRKTENMTLSPNCQGCSQNVMFMLEDDVNSLNVVTWQNSSEMRDTFVTTMMLGEDGRWREILTRAETYCGGSYCKKSSSEVYQFRGRRLECFRAIHKKHLSCFQLVDGSLRENFVSKGTSIGEDYKTMCITRSEDEGRVYICGTEDGKTLCIDYFDEASEEFHRLMEKNDPVLVFETKENVKVKYCKIFSDDCLMIVCGDSCSMIIDLEKKRKMCEIESPPNVLFTVFQYFEKNKCLYAFSDEKDSSVHVLSLRHFLDETAKVDLEERTKFVKEEETEGEESMKLLVCKDYSSDAQKSFSVSKVLLFSDEKEE